MVVSRLFASSTRPFEVRVPAMAARRFITVWMLRAGVDVTILMILGLSPGRCRVPDQDGRQTERADRGQDLSWNPLSLVRR